MENVRTGRADVARRVLVGAASTGAASALWAIMRLIVRTAFVTHAQWIDALSVPAILLGCVFLCACRYLDIRWLLCAVWVRVRQIQWSAGDGMGDSAHLYTVTVLDGPPLAPVEENQLMDWKWVVGGTHTVTVDPQGDVPLGRGGKPGPPVIQWLLQIPLVLGLALALGRRPCPRSPRPDPLSHRGV
ncbi:hypothetical protein ABZ646_24100 [Streptomyces sp. NPDC007162]|uniref:hypothetical protein n=1 Tax=Streptomyces sp. NPDC007162 TaxID=3156917 RepID=UPI0033CB8498